jgi:hypothetical protein
MDRRAFLAAITGSVLGGPLADEAQPAGSVYRIGILGDKASDSNEILLWQTFRAGLRDHGWNEGVNIRMSTDGSRAAPVPNP